MFNSLWFKNNFFFAFYIYKLFENLFLTDAMSTGKITFEGNPRELHFKKYSHSQSLLSRILFTSDNQRL